MNRSEKNATVFAVLILFLHIYVGASMVWGIGLEKGGLGIVGIIALFLFIYIIPFSMWQDSETTEPMIHELGSKEVETQ